MDESNFTPEELEEMDRFFKESPLFEEYRRLEKIELEKYQRRRDFINSLPESFRCDRCRSKNTSPRNIIVGWNLEQVSIKYCHDCHFGGKFK